MGSRPSATSSPKFKLPTGKMGTTWKSSLPVHAAFVISFRSYLFVPIFLSNIRLGFSGSFLSAFAYLVYFAVLGFLCCLLFKFRVPVQSVVSFQSYLSASIFLPKIRLISVD
jgi:hypothetical protein